MFQTYWAGISVWEYYVVRARVCCDGDVEAGSPKYVIQFNVCAMTGGVLHLNRYI